MNIGLENLRRTTTVVPSMETLFGQYVACESAFSNTNKFVAYGEQLIETFDNLVSLRSTAAKFNSTEGLAVLNDLVGHEFAGNVSLETIGEGAKAVWVRIKEFFKKIWEWIKYFFNRIMNFFFGAEKRLGKLLAEVKAIKGDKIRPWKLPVPSNVPELVAKTMKEIEPNLKKIDTAKTDLSAMKQVKPIIESVQKRFEEYKLGEEHEITSKEETSTVIAAVTVAVALGKPVKLAMENTTKALQGFASGLEKKGEVALAKEAVDILKSATKLVNKGCTVTSRLAAVILTRCKPVAPDKETKKK